MAVHIQYILYVYILYLYICVCMFVCIKTYIYTHIYTYLYIFICIYVYIWLDCSAALTVFTGFVLLVCPLFIQNVLYIWSNYVVCCAAVHQDVWKEVKRWSKTGFFVLYLSLLWQSCQKRKKKILVLVFPQWTKSQEPIDNKIKGLSWPVSDGCVSFKITTVSIRQLLLLRLTSCGL